MTHEQRSLYFTNHPEWTQFYASLSELSSHKCWYSETPEGACEFEVDHFRPKNRSKNINGEIILPDGYWWLAYNIFNFRLSGSLVNRRRRDRFIADEEIKGKGDYFPLKLDECQASLPYGDLDFEINYLLDPTKFRDTTLLGFDKDGKPIPTATHGTFDYERASISIEYLGLDHTPLNRQRKQVWENCENEILEISRKIKNNLNEAMRNKVLTDSYARIRQLASKNNPYSSVAVNCIYSNSVQYDWLKPILVHLG
jgi:hypothetical protein